MELRHLKNFLTVIEQKSISKAANIIRLAQPALSRQLQALEDELRVPLLFRHGWGISPTPEGEILAKHARTLLDQAQSARDAIGAASNSPVGRLAIGVPSSMAVLVLPELAKMARQLLPRVQLRLVEGYSATLRQRLALGELDFAILYADRKQSGLVTRPLLTEPLVAIGAPGMFGPATTVSMRDLVSSNLIMPASANQLRSLFEQSAADAGVSNAVALEMDSVAAVIELVASGAGTSVLPGSTIQEAARNGRISFARIEPECLERELVLARAIERIETPMWTAMVDVLFQILKAGEQKYGWKITCNQHGEGDFQAE